MGRRSDPSAQTAAACAVSGGRGRGSELTRNSRARRAGEGRTAALHGARRAGAASRYSPLLTLVRKSFWR